MYSKAEASKIKEQFWTAFGQYMAPVPSAECIKINWVNYKTGFKDLYFRMFADNKIARIGIEMTHNDAGIQQLYFEQFAELKFVLHDFLAEEWSWQLHIKDEFGKTISRIYTQTDNVNIYNRENWPQLIGFFKPRIIALDAFWTDAKYSFEALQ